MRRQGLWHASLESVPAGAATAPVLHEPDQTRGDAAWLLTVETLDQVIGRSRERDIAIEIARCTTGSARNFDVGLVPRS
jgi:hypothetical protein